MLWKQFNFSFILILFINLIKNKHLFTFLLFLVFLSAVISSNSHFSHFVVYLLVSEMNLFIFSSRLCRFSFYFKILEIPFFSLFHFFFLHILSFLIVVCDVYIKLYKNRKHVHKDSLTFVGIFIRTFYFIFNTRLHKNVFVSS